MRIPIAFYRALGAVVGSYWVVPCAEGTLIPLFIPILDIAEALVAFVLSRRGDRVKFLDPYRDTCDIKSIRNSSFCFVFGCKRYYNYASSLAYPFLSRGKLVWRSNHL